MKYVVRAILGVVVGILVCGAVIASVQMIGMAVYPPPADIDWNDREALRQIIEQMPLGSMLFILASYTLGTFCGAWLAARIAGHRPLIPALIVAGFFLLASVVNLYSLPGHPTWFMIANLALFVPVAWLASLLVPGPTRQEA